MSKTITRASVAGTSLDGAGLKAALTGLVDALTTAGLHSGTRSTINADATLTVEQCGLVPVDCTGGNITLTLPASGDTTDDAVFLFRRLDNTANTLTIARSGSDTIEGASTSKTVAGLGILGLQIPADGTDWNVFGLGGATPAAARTALGVLQDVVRIDVATASSVNLTTAAPNTRDIRFTGTTTVNGFTVAAGVEYVASSAADFTLTNNSSIVTNTGANISVKVGDSFTVRATASNTVEIVNYCTAAGVGKTPITSGDLSTLKLIASTIGAVAASASGTAIACPDTVPSNLKKFRVPLRSVSTNGASALLLQLRVGGTYKTSGYTVQTGASVYTTGVGMPYMSVGTDAVTGFVDFTLVDETNFIWQISGSVGRDTAATVGAIIGYVTLTGAPDGWRVTTVGGDTFDGGNIGGAVYDYRV